MNSVDSTAPVLGIECGGTRTVAILADASGRCLQRVEAGPANARLLTDAQLRRHLRSLAEQFVMPAALGLGLAGVREAADRRRVHEVAASAWPRVPCWVGNDLETALAAAPQEGPWDARVVVISGTGSCAYGQNSAGRTAKVGGWGHLLGDRGSGYHLAMSALRSVVATLDRTGRWPRLGSRFLRALAMNEPNDLVTWTLAASKTEIATLAVEVFAAWHDGDRLARAAVEAAAAELADQGVACAAKLARPQAQVLFVLTGSLFAKQPRFAAAVGRKLRNEFTQSNTRLLQHEGAWGAVKLARSLLANAETAPHPIQIPKARPTAAFLPQATGPSPTEQRHPRSMQLDRMPLRDAIRLMLGEDARIPRALLRAENKIARAVRMIARALRRGGRLIYVGAGTSGRLGVLDASECPPTFSVPPDMIQGIIAGGQSALWQSVEGAEDDADAGAKAIRGRGANHRDIVIGIAASGRTPFVWGALAEARHCRARTMLLCFNPHLRFQAGARPDLVIAVDLGPEILTGSTRLKAGTATKLLLNLLTTLTMVRLGKVVSNLMMDVKASNSKLRDRARGIVQTLTGCSSEIAFQALQRSGWRVKAAVLSIRK